MKAKRLFWVSCFDSVRREVALRSIHRLLEEGRVHPARIEEVVGKIKRDIFSSMMEEGKQVCFDLGLHDVRPALIETLGTLKYRLIGSNNVLKSSVEVAHLAGLIAGELRMEEKTAKRAGLLHAVGLGVDHRVEGSYSSVGADHARKQGESPLVCQAIRCHRGGSASRIRHRSYWCSRRIIYFMNAPGASRDVMGELHFPP